MTQPFSHFPTIISRATPISTTFPTKSLNGSTIPSATISCRHGITLEHAFQLLNGVFTTVDAPPFAYESYAYGINNSGKMVGGYDNGDQSQNYALFGLPENFAPFTLPNTPPAGVDFRGFVFPGTDSQTFPLGLNDQNDVVGYYYEFGLPQYFFPQALSGTDRQGPGKGWMRPPRGTRIFMASTIKA